MMIDGIDIPWQGIPFGGDPRLGTGLWMVDTRGYVVAVSE